MPALRLFSDPVVARLLDPMAAAVAGGPMRAQLLSELGPGTYGSQVMRTRYIDEVVNGLAEGGTTQVVILGAGLDTRAYRLPALAAATVFELDLPGTQQYAVQRLRGVPALAAEVRFVATDFTSEPLGAVLASAGVDRERPVLFVWEGVTQYLTEAAVRSTLACVGASVPGSALVFTYVLRSIVDGTSGNGWSDGLRQRLDASEPWLFGIEPTKVPALLDGYGLSLIDDVGEAEYRSRYAVPMGRQLAVNAGERAALAVVSRTGR